MPRFSASPSSVFCAGFSGAMPPPPPLLEEELESLRAAANLY
jgi:hypothetical protein